MHAKKNYDSSVLNDYYDGLDRRATHNWLNFEQQAHRFEFSAEQKNEIGLILVNDSTALNSSAEQK
jgi:hypothetical protein